MPKSPHPDKLLSIYLNDHLAGSTAGVQLARRLHASNRDDRRFGTPLADIRAEVETAARIGERLGRLKPNGQLTGYSPLSRVVELELLLIGITGKKRMWSVVEQARGANLAIDFSRLIDRAERQRTVVAELHVTAAAIAFAPTEGRRADSVDTVKEAAVGKAAP